MGIGAISSARAVFLDRDGVINRNVWNPVTEAHEAPRRVEEFALLPGALDGLRRLQDAGFLLFLVSNQPDYATGKATPRALDEVHGALALALDKAGIAFSAFYYCHHHPDGVIKEYGGPCICRKPSPYFLLEAEKSFHLSMNDSWMVGDRETDVACGLAAGVHTIRIAGNRGAIETRAQFQAGGLPEAADIIVNPRNR